MVDYLSEDLIIKILLRLPIISLVHFRCVYKSWFALLSDPKFIYKKLFFDGENDFNDNSPHHVIVRRKDNSNLKSVFSLFSCDTFEMSTPQEIPYPKDIMKNMSDILIVGSPTSDGFICLRDEYDLEIVLIYKKEYVTDCNMFLWNPLTSEINIIPQCNTSNFNYRTLQLVEFGFDRKNNDYKIFKMFFVYYNDGQRVPDKKIEIFSLKNGSWREVDIVVPNILTALDGKCHFTGANGMFHWWDWWADDDGKIQTQIVSFDLSNEIFKTAALPDGLKSIKYLIWTFFCLSDCVATVTYSDYLSEDSIEIWIMFEYGVKESWTKLFSISSLSPLQTVERALGFGRNGEIFMATWCGQLLLWNPIAEAITEFQIDGYKESLQIVTLIGEPGSIN